MNDNPVLFIGHGSPMNAIEDNEFSRCWKEIAETLPRPQAIVSISAHWETEGTLVTAAEKPATIHDFYGFPEELFRQVYPAPGSPGLAKEMVARKKSHPLTPDMGWGLDHGTWSVLMHLFPEADVPVVQLSLDRRMEPADHYRLAVEIRAFRDEGILFLCSGNIVHNLGMVKWTGTGLADIAYPWAEAFDRDICRFLQDSDSSSLLEYRKLGNAAQLSVPTPEHFLPLIYFSGLRKEKERITVHCNAITGGSISMTSFVTV